MNRHNTRRRGPSLSIVILIIAMFSIGFGFLFNVGCTLVERQIYPKNYVSYVEAYAVEFDVPPNVLYAVIRAESNFNAAAVSDDGQVGLMQLSPETARWLADDILHEYPDDRVLYDPDTNIRYGACLLSHLYAVYGDWETVMAAYDAGTAQVDGWLKDSRYSSDGVHLKVSAVPLAQTQAYIKRVSKTLTAYDTLYPDGSLAPSEIETTQEGAA